MFNRAKLGKVAYEQRITTLYFSSLPLLFLAASAAAFPYLNPAKFYLYPVFDVFAVLFVLTFSKFFMCNIYFAAVAAHDNSISFKNVAVMRSGVPGAGKTSSQAYEVIQLARLMWEELQYKYKQYRGKLNGWRVEGNIKMIARWNEAKFAYRFYMKNIETHIPCLWSNIQLELDGRVSYDLTLNHLMQLERMPGYSVLNHDDSGASLPAELAANGNKVPPSLNRFMRYIRHFGFILRTNDQRVTNLFIGARSVIAYNIEMITMTNVCQARLLMFIKKRLKPLLLSLPDNTPNVYSRFTGFMYALDELINLIGFRRYTAMKSCGTESEVKLPPVPQTFYVPRGLNCNYDDRAYMLCYEALPLKVESPIYDLSPFVDPNDYVEDNALVAGQHEQKKPAVKTKQRPSREERRLKT